MSKPVIVNESDFQEIVENSDIPVLVDFWAEWCGPCKIIAPTVEEISQKNFGKLVVGKVNIDTNPNLAEKYQVRSIPTIIIFIDTCTYTLYYIINVSKISFHISMIKYRHWFFLSNFFCKNIHCHIWSAPRTINCKKS